MTIQEGNYVGIGTTSPNTTLDVNGTITTPAFINVTNSDPGDLISKRYGSADRYGIGQYTNGVTRVFTSGTFAGSSVRISKAADDLRTGAATFTDLLTVLNGGNVGIGSTSPVCKLDVIGGPIRTYTSSDVARLIIGPAPSATNLDYSSLIESVSTFASNYASTLRFYTHGNAATGADPTLAMTINSSQQVGIGTNAPAYKLEVIGIGNMIAATNLQSTVTQMLGTSTTIGFAGTKTNHNTYIVSNNGAGGNIVLNAAGTAFFPLSGSTCELGGAGNRWSTIYAVNALNTSDRNLKENISDAPLGIDFVNALNPKTFTWKEYTQTVVNPVTDEPRTVTKPAGTRLQYGLIAQDVKDVLDKFGIDSKDFAGYVDSTVNEPDKPQVLYLNYIQFIPILIKSVKELSAENTTLKQSLASMESRLAALEARG
jgi:hypothetical protein